MPAGYKPSPLSYGSPRSSPFRRPESPTSPSPSALRSSTPAASPSKISASGSTQRLTAAYSLASSSSPGPAAGWNSRAKVDPDDTPTPSPPRQTAIRMPAVPNTSNIAPSHGSSLSKLQPSQVRTLREGFQILDRDSDGVVNREDITDMLTQLGTLPVASVEFLTVQADTDKAFQVYRRALRTCLGSSPRQRLKRWPCRSL
jgi:hypothetical protein